jgi:hypothetical protein
MSNIANKAGWALALVLGLLFIMSAGRMAFGDGGALEPPGAPAPGMKSLQEVEPRTPISSIPYTITQPGSYYLTGNLTATASDTGITVAASHVTIDLNGFTLSGGTLGDHGIFAYSINRFTVRNGTVSDWLGSGIEYYGQEGHFEDLVTVGNGAFGLYLLSTSIVKNVVATHNTYGVAVGGNGSTISDVVAVNNELVGIRVEGNYNRVENNNVVANALGVYVLGGNNFIVRNSASVNTTNFSIAPANFAPIETSPSVTNPWSNVNY